MPGFKDIVGQKQIKEHLQSAIRSGKVGHAYIISGERFSGKEFVARAFAQTLQCEEGGTEPCGKCHSCLQAESRNHPDILYLSHESHPNSIGVEDVRDQIISDAIIRPYSSPYKVYIVNEAEKMTTQAQNALLKTLEEPPSYVVILLLTTNAGTFLQTVRSRCEMLTMKPVPDAEIREYLMEHCQVPDYHAKLCTAFAQGNFGPALQMVASDEFQTIQKVTTALLRQQHDMPMSEKIALIQSMAQYKMDPEEFLDIIMVWYRDVLMYKATGDADSLVNYGDIAIIRKAAGRCSYEGLDEVLEAVNKARARLKAYVNFELTMELLLATMQEKG